MDSREAFEKWCPYKGNPDPYTVWMECWPIAQAEAQQTIAAMRSGLNNYQNLTFFRILKGAATGKLGVGYTLPEGGFHIVLMCPDSLSDITTIAGLQALLKEKDNALRNDIIARQKLGWLSHVYPLGAILDEALSHTSPTDALERYRDEVLEEAANIIYSKSLAGAHATRDELRRMKKGELI